MKNPNSQSSMRMVFKIKPFYKSKSPPPLRVADVLLLQEHQEEKLLLMDGGEGLNSSTPPQMVARLFCCLKRGKVKTTVGDGGVDDREKKDDDVATHYVTVPPPDSSSTETCRVEACNFNVGMECCLVHLISESKKELLKMTELRIEIETALEKFKDEFQNKLQITENHESIDGTVEEPAFNCNLELNNELLDQSRKCEVVAKEDDCVEEMDTLEAELEVELERLQFHLDFGELPANPPQEIIEESATESITTTKSNTICCGEVIDPTVDHQEEEEDGCYLNSGVHPYELERKLHELLETRQQEQIRELEAALRIARQELHEKEREISRWKETAHHMSRHFKEPSRYNFQHGEHTDHHFFR